VRRCGGGSRQASVLNGLLGLAEFGATDQDWVLVHDAARPGITPTLIRTLVATLKDDPVGGILALPVADTLKRVPTGGDAIARTESRDARGRRRRRRCFASACCATPSCARSAKGTT
jgi:2-C-methyl-D-erythritol 4-phosphate cytidylyltransferase